MTRSIAILSLAVLTLGCGTLLSSTRVFQVDVVRDGQEFTPGQPLDLGAGAAVETNLALGDNDTYEKYHDEIKSVDRAGFEGLVANPGGADGTLSLYFSTTPGLADPVNEATPLLVGFPIPAAGLELTYTATEAALLNMETFGTAVKAADFALYVVAGSGSALQVSDLRLIIAFTVGV